MSKHRHSKDKLHLTYSEIHQQNKKQKAPFEHLPFYCCALSLAPFQDPVCTPQGHVFDILYIMPFIKKYQRNPVTGAPLKVSDLVKMHWTPSQNPHNPIQYQDPISYKIFTQFTHIVCIKTSGYVYTYETIQQLNKKPKNFQDLMTDEPFELSDIIHIQDPKNSKIREVQEFDYLKNSLPFIPPEKLQPSAMQNQTVSKVMEEVQAKKRKRQEQKEAEEEQKLKKKRQLEDKADVKSFIEWSIENKIFKHERETDLSSASLTSTSFTPLEKAGTNFRELKKSQIRNKIYTIVQKKKMKGFVQIITNLGNMNFLIHADLAPKTSENFIQLTESGYYDDSTFHRLVKDFCLQGGDPKGTGGNSIFGYEFEDEFHPKLSHKKAGLLSMANSGPNTNRSQFFITLKQRKQLDNVHTIFGQIISNQELLEKINLQYGGKNEKPKHPITIKKMFCYDNPFRKAIKEIKEKLDDEKKEKVAEKKQKQKERWLQEGNKFSLPSKSTKKGESSLANQLLNDFL